jgi:outer membrane protein, heavy metal efflux system
MVRTLVLAALAYGLVFQGVSQPSTDQPVVTLDQLIGEALERNPELIAAHYQVAVAEGRASQAGVLPPPTLSYMRDQMNNFVWNEAMMDQWELMQMVMFPTKLSAQSAIGRLQRLQSLKDAAEKAADVRLRVRSAFAEFWSLQKSRKVVSENVGLMKQFAEIARTRVSVGTGSLGDAMKAEVEAAKMENQLIGLEKKEQGMAAMLAALTGRPPGDPIGTAVLPEFLDRPLQLDSLLALATEHRPMVQRDSLMVEEAIQMLSMAHQEYLPDLTFGIRYYRFRQVDQRAWSVMAGISIPFVPWSIGRSAGRVEEAEAGLRKSRANLDANRSMVIAGVTELHYRTDAARQQLRNYYESILPQAHDALMAGVSAYQTGKADFLLLLDSFRMNLELSMEAIMTRMQFEQSSAELDRAIGFRGSEKETR